MSLVGKLALVTGSTSGIGLGVARQLAKAGANVVLNGFGNAKEIEALQKELSDTYKVKTFYHGADLSKPAEIESLIAESGKHGSNGVDILVNNAGIQYVSSTEKFPVEKWDQIININMSAVFHATRLVLPSMQKKNWGRIINIASVHGLCASVDKSAYVASKHGVVGLTKVVALENARTGVTCNAICPGFVLTPLIKKQIDDKAAAAKISYDQMKVSFLEEKHPSAEFVTPDQLGALAVFLSSDAASEVRGVAWNMDGGWMAR